MILYYVRHGLPNYEEDSLKELGRYQADETSKFLATINFDMIFSSPLGRAKETASYLEKRINKTAIILPFANESIAHHYFHLLNEETNERQWLFFNPTWRTYLNELRDDPNWYDSKYFKEPRFKEATEYYSREIDECLQLIEKGVTVTTFGDMLRVPGSNGSLAEAKAEGADGRVVYGIPNAVEIADAVSDRAECVFLSDTGASAKIKAFLETTENVIVLFGDMPLITAKTLKDAVAEHLGKNNDVTVLGNGSDADINSYILKADKLLTFTNISSDNSTITRTSVDTYKIRS